MINDMIETRYDDRWNISIQSVAFIITHAWYQYTNGLNWL